MKTKILVVFIILCSILGGVLGAKLQYSFFPEEKTVDKKGEFVKNSTITNIDNIESSITQIVKKASPSVVSIIIKKDLIIYRSDPRGFFREAVGSIKRKVGGGTGFFIKKDGTLITNKHVISDTNATYTIITNDGKEFDGNVLALDPVNDLAIIKIKSITQSFVPLKIINKNEKINLGQFAIAIGNALSEFQNSVSFGVISGKDRIVEVGREKITGLIQTDAAINPGNSGGPLIDINGNVIGINTAIIDGSEGIGFAIGLTQKKIDYMLNSIEKHGKIKKPFIGVSYIQINNNVKEKLDLKSNYGAYVSFVSPGSSAEKSGIKPGDTILEVDGKKIIGGAELNYIIQNKIPKEKIKLKILRKSGKTEKIELELGEI